MENQNGADFFVTATINCPLNPPSVGDTPIIKLVGGISLYQRDFDLLNPTLMTEQGKINDNLIEGITHALFSKNRIKKYYVFFNAICYDVLFKCQYT